MDHDNENNIESKIEFIMQSIDSIQHRLDLKECEWDKHRKVYHICSMIMKLLEESKSLPEKTVNMELEEGLKKEHKEWHKHQMVAGTFKEVLTKHHDLLDEDTIDRLIDYLTKLIYQCSDGNLISNGINAFKLFRLGKINSSLASLISSMESELKSERNEWYRHQNMFWVIQSVLKRHRDSLEGVVINQIFNYLTKIIRHCEDGNLISHGLDAFGLFPLSKLETSLPGLIDSMESEMVTEQNKWYRHQNVSGAIQSVLEVHQNSLDKAVIDLMFDYLTKLIRQCEDYVQIFNGLYAFGLFPLSKHETSLPGLIDSMESEMVTEQNKWYRHQNMSGAIQSVLENHRDSLDKAVIDLMLDYLTKLIRQCEDYRQISLGFGAFILFPLSKLETSLPLLIDSMECELETKHNRWYRHQNVSRIIHSVLKYHRDSLDESVIDQMFDYLTKIIRHCEDGDLISFVIWAFNLFPMSKLESSLPLLIESFGNELGTKQNEWHRHQNMSWVIQSVLEDHRDSLDESVMDQMFDYLTKLIRQCEDGDLISFGIGAFKLFPMSKLEISLPLLIDSMECELKSEQNEWYRHQNMSGVIQSVLKVHRDSLDESVMDQMFDYLTKLIRQCKDGDLIFNGIYAFGILPLSKLETSLLLFITSIESEMVTEQNEWYRHQNMSWVIQSVLEDHRDSLAEAVIDQMFDYLTKLISQCKDYRQILLGFWAFTLFPLSKLETSLPLLIDSMESELEAKQNEWYRHQNMSVVILSVLKVHRDSLDESVMDQMFDYLTKLIRQCEDYDQISNGIEAFELFPLSKLETSLPLLIDLMESELKAKQNEWYTYQNMCGVIQLVLTANRDSLNESVINRMFDYLTKLIRQCEDGHLISFGICAFTLFPLSKLETSLPVFITSIESELETKQNRWYRHENVSRMIQVVLDEHRVSLCQTLITRMFDYFIKLIHHCEEVTTVEIVILALLRFTPSKLHSIIQLFCFEKNKLHFQINESNIAIFHEKNLVDNPEKLNLNCKLNRNLILLIKHMNFNYELQDKEFASIIFDFLLKQMSQNQNLELSSFLIPAIENVYYNVSLTNESKHKLFEKVSNFAKFHIQYPIEKYLTTDFNYLKYKVGWCAQWLLDNVLNSKTISSLQPSLKISSDRLCARNEYSFPSVRSSFSVHSGVYFYEVILLTDGVMQIGWTTREARFGGGGGVGDDAHSIGIDAYRSFIWHANKSKTKGHEIQNLSKWKVGDVVGCLINFENKRFAFYLNGRQFECPDKVHFSSQPYFAGATLEEGQQCYFNFGQLPFKFPPIGIEFMDFHKTVNGNASKYYLMETCKVTDKGEEYYWFKNIANNRIDPFFYGKEQEKWGEFIKAIELFVEKEQEIDLIKLERYLINDQYRFLRFIQSAIEFLGKNKKYIKTDIIANWIGKFIERQFKPAPIEKLCELIYPYLQQNSSLNISRYRNIRIVLSTLIKLEKLLNCFFVQYIRHETFDAFTRTFSETSDEWAKLFALIGLENLEMNQQEKIQIVNDEFVLNLADGWNENTYENLIKQKATPIGCQVSFESQHLLAKLNSKSANENEECKERLNINDRTEQLKLSIDLLSARSDFNRQSVRSQCSANSNIYYEVVLLTNGEVDIGWAPKSDYSTKLDKNSVCFDGYKQVIKHNDNNFFVKSVPRWKAGDIIGCLLDAENDRFRFYLNGRLTANYSSNIKISSHLYYAFASLSTHQQCYFNFGQFEFQYAPKRFKFSSLSKQIIQSKFIVNLENAHINQSILNINSKIVSGDITLIQNKTTISVDSSSSTKRQCISHLSDKSGSPSSPNHPTEQQEYSTAVATIQSEEYGSPPVKKIKLSESHRALTHTECCLCAESITTKLVRFKCCSSRALCLNCVKLMRNCQKCSKQPSSSSIETNAECRLCANPIQIQILQFVCCSKINLCIDCLSRFVECPKCKLKSK